MRNVFSEQFRRAASRRALLLGGAGAAVLAATPGAAGSRNPARSRPAWTGSWTAASTATGAREPALPADVTLRQVVRLSLGGAEPRIRLTNEYGPSPVRLGEVWTGLRAGGWDSTAMRPGTIRRVTFGGLADVLLPAGGTLVSDPVPDLLLEPGADLVITCHLPERTRLGTVNPTAWQKNRVVPGNVAGRPDPSGGIVTTRYALLGGVSVRTAARSSAIVAFGDSITCGARTTMGGNHRWPDLLARRLRETGRPLGVLNTGISGNRLLTGPDLPAPVTGGGSGGGGGSGTGQAKLAVSMGPAGLRRFDRDVLSQPGAGYLITMIGVNDIAYGVPGAGALIAGHRELIARGRAAGLAVYGGTVLPFAGTRRDTPVNRTTRAGLNDWIRRSGEFDAVIDFDAAVRDGASPERLYPAYDSGDHLHPSDAGMLALASAIPLALFD
ncbi:SGNH/GDSL hydrolase family protein [Actinoplanes palleronii]|uniref:SGNH/GDSL hydrolase family protein n=1 Tax=Actinoplanes palleronii TaxID=113570 RepID=UPI001941D22E|nr:SGNH/GDSL hydrolase family protein [Actinoplanes palleronii]